MTVAVCRWLAYGDGGRIGFPDVLRGPVHVRDPPVARIVDQLAANDVFTVDKQNRLVFCRDLGKWRLLMHAQIAETESPLSIQMIEIGLQHYHGGVHRSSFGTGLGSGTLRMASNCSGVKPKRS